MILSPSLLHPNRAGVQVSPRLASPSELALRNRPCCLWIVFSVRPTLVLLTKSSGTSESPKLLTEKGILFSVRKESKCLNHGRCWQRMSSSQNISTESRAPTKESIQFASSFIVFVEPSPTGASRMDISARRTVRSSTTSSPGCV